MTNIDKIKSDIKRIEQDKTGAKYISVHCIQSLKARDEITSVWGNIPFSIETLKKVALMYPDSDNWYIQIHSSKINFLVVN